MKQVTLAKEAAFVEIDENDVEEFLASCDQDLTKELMQLQEPKIQWKPNTIANSPKGIHPGTECEALT